VIALSLAMHAWKKVKKEPDVKSIDGDVYLIVLRWNQAVPQANFFSVIQNGWDFPSRFLFCC